jgi:predicted nucleic acid-binding protein
MEWVKKLSGSIIGLDTAPLIYFVEERAKYLPLVDPFFEAVERGEIEVVTSTLTLTEVLVHPFRQGNRIIAERYSRILLNSKNLKTVPATAEVATEAAQIRATHGLKAPDALQIATARLANATAFLTNDDRFASIPGHGDRPSR